MTMRKKLTEYLQIAEDKKVKAMYTMVEDEIEAGVWNKEFVEELERREKSFLDGSARMYSLEEARQIARARYNNNK
jgi:hypothetical protein